MNRIWSVLVTCGSIFIGLILWGIAYFTQNAELGYISAGLLFVGCIIGSLLNRCPSCGHWLGRHHWRIEYCPYCGEYL